MLGTEIAVSDQSGITTTAMASYNELKFDWEMLLENVRGSRNGSSVGE